MSDTTFPAFRSFRSNEGLPLRTSRLPQGDVDSELRCFHCWCRCIHYSGRAAGYDQDPYSERKLRAQGQRNDHSEGIDQERGS